MTPMESARIVAPVEIKTPVLRDLPLDLLDAGALNPRKTFDEAALNELAASIRQIGITNPLIVRPEPMIDGLIEQRYEIIAGHRRCEAATLAGLEVVPCIVSEREDSIAAVMALSDNVQRVDVPPLEEAEAFGELQNRLGSVEAVAARVGKDVPHVAKRLKLLSLGNHEIRALAERLITVDHALLLARLGVAEQDQGLKWCLDRNAGSKTPVDTVIDEVLQRRKRESKNGSRYALWEPETVQRLKEHIEQTSGRKLSRAPWALDDAELLEGAPACDACPSNTKANTSLFGDLDIEAATCADGGCFERKRAAFVEIQLAAASPRPVVKLSWKASSIAPRMEKDGSGPSLTQIFKDGQWVEAKKKSCEHLCAGVTVDWNDGDGERYVSGKRRKPGEVLQVCVDPKCKAHPKEYAKPKDKERRVDENSAEAKAEREKRAAAARDETRLRVRLAGEAIAKIKMLPDEVFRVLLLAVDNQLYGGEKERNAILPGYQKLLSTAKAGSAQLAQAAALLTLEWIDVDKWSNSIEDGRKDFIASLKRLGYDASKAWDKPKREAEKPAKSTAKKAAAKKAMKKGGAK